MLLFGSDCSGVRMSGETEQNVRRTSLETLVTTEDTEPGKVASRFGCIRRIIDPCLDRSGDEEMKRFCRTATASSVQNQNRLLRAQCFLMGLYNPSWAIQCSSSIA